MQELHHSVRKKRRWATAPAQLAIALGLALASCTASHSQDAAATPPAGYSVIGSDVGVTVYRSNSANVFLQIVDLDQGAGLSVISDERDGVDLACCHYAETNGAPSTQAFSRLAIQDARNTLSMNSPSQAFTIVNASFFCNDCCATNENTPVQYPLTVGGVQLTAGYGSDGTCENCPTRALSISRDSSGLSSAQITEEPIPGASDVIVANSPAADRDSDQGAARTFVGLSDPDNDGSDEVFILSVASAKTQDVVEMLNALGVPEEQMLMLDGGGSTQLQWRQGLLLESTDRPPRQVPVYLGTVGTPGLGGR